VAKLEKKVQTVLKDAQIVRDNKDLQIAELKKIAEESTQTRTNRSVSPPSLPPPHPSRPLPLSPAPTLARSPLSCPVSPALPLYVCVMLFAGGLLYAVYRYVMLFAGGLLYAVYRYVMLVAGGLLYAVYRYVMLFYVDGLWFVVRSI